MFVSVGFFSVYKLRAQPEAWSSKLLQKNVVMYCLCRLLYLSEATDIWWIIRWWK